MIWLAKIFVAWLSAIALMTVMSGPPGRPRASAPSWDGLLGIGLVVGLPMLLFAFVIALPLSLLVAYNLSPVAGAILYPFLIAGAAWLIGALFLSGGWKGVQRTMTLFAAIMGTSWSLLSLLI